MGTVAFFSCVIAVENSYAAEPEQITTTSLKIITPVISTDYLTNPGIGFQAIQNFDNPTLPETVAYRRSHDGWALYNPAENVYDWSTLDTELANAISRGQQLSFHIYTMQGERFGGHNVPQWVLDKGAVILPQGDPLYTNCTYQVEWARFVNQLRLRYDGNPHIAFIDISGYGNFNEWSWMNHQTTYDPNFLNPSTLDGMARNRLADIFIGGANTIQCTDANGVAQTVSYNYPGFQQTQLLMPYSGIQQASRYVAARRSDVGLRHNCLGAADADRMLDKIGDVITATWANAPIVYELCGPENIQDADRVMRLTHGSLVHENRGRNDVAELTDMLRYAGYRFALTQATYPGVVNVGESFPLSMIWQNIGHAPAYAKMGQTFQLKFRLLRPNNTVAQSWDIQANVNSWLPPHPLTTPKINQQINQNLSLSAGVSPGTYTTCVMMLDTRTNLPIQLSIAGANTNGCYHLDSLQVTSQTTEYDWHVYLPVILSE